MKKQYLQDLKDLYRNSIYKKIIKPCHISINYYLLNYLIFQKFSKVLKTKKYIVLYINEKIGSRCII